MAKLAYVEFGRFELDPLTVTIAAAALTGSGLLSNEVRALLASIFRRPRKTSLLVRHDDEYTTIDLDDQVVAHITEHAHQMGLSSEQAAVIAEAVRAQWKSSMRGDKPASDRRGEADDVN